MISRIKRNELVGRRVLFSLFQNQHLVNRVADQVVERFGERKGGYTRMRKIKRRKGDNALLVSVELLEGWEKIVKEEEVKQEKSEDLQSKSKRN